MNTNTLNILADAISDIGSWWWWDIEGDIVQVEFRDVLLYKATRDTDNLVFRRELAEIKREATICSYEGLEDMIEAVNKASARIRANVNFDLTVELLFLTFADNLKE